MAVDSLIASTTQFQTLLIALVLIVAVIYFFIELRRVDSRINFLETSLKKLMNDKEIQLNNTRDMQYKIDVVENDEIDTYVEDELNKDVHDKINTGNYVEDELTGEDEINGEVVEVLSNSKKEELETNIESIAVSGLSILSYMPTVNTVSNIVEELDVEELDVEELDEGSNVEGSNVDGSNVEGSNVEGSNVEESDVERSNVEESDVERSNVEELDVEELDVEELDVEEQFDIKELDISEPVEGNTITNKENVIDMTIKELKGLLTNMNLPTSGNKTKLIQRIVSNQK
jgi:uncharacterized protein YoxC